MVAAITLFLGLAILGLAAFVIRFLAGLTLLAIGIVLFVVIAAYGLSFLGLFFILGEPNIGWAIFGAMGFGSLIVSTLLKKAKEAISSLIGKQANLK